MATSKSKAGAAMRARKRSKESASAPSSNVSPAEGELASPARPRTAAKPKRARGSGPPRTPKTVRDDERLKIVHGDNLAFLKAEPDERYRLIYVDPPFNTGERQTLRSIQVERDENGDRVGFAGVRYKTVEVARRAFDDRHDDYLGFLEPRLAEARRVLSADGSLFVHVDPRESHYVKVLLDGLFGRASFQNEIVWAYDYGARTKTRWPAKHDVILWYAKDPKRYVFRYDDVDRVPYLAPRLVGEEKARRGKTPTDVWWQTIVPPGGKERTGYPTQKPLAILRRIVRVHSDPGDEVLDFFAGSGTTGAAALELGRRCTLVDANREAIAVMRKRLAATPSGPSSPAARAGDRSTR